MKRLLSIWLTFLLAIFMGISFVACDSEEEDESGKYCDPRGKVWYNEESLPNIEEPFEEGYDGSCYIQIDEDGNVLFKPLDGEEIKGTLTTSEDKLFKQTEVSISLENGRTATGDCWQNKYGRNLRIWYYDKFYYFDDEQKISKEEFEEYRGQFVDFLIGVYETGIFPTEEEISKNKQYIQFTHYYQIDPHCGGPITYSTVEKATIKEIRSIGDEEEAVLEIGGETVVCSLSRPNVAFITRSGEIQKLTNDDVRTGECLVYRESYTSYREETYGEETHSIKGIFYIEGTFEEPAEPVPFRRGDLGGDLKKQETDLYENTLVLIRTKEELISVFSEIEMVWEDKPIWERFDESFFETQGLIFLIRVESGQNSELTVKSVGVKDDEVIVYATKYNSDDDGTVALCCLLFVGKEEVASASNIKIEYL